MTDWLDADVMISLAILVSLGVVLWRAGARNPIPTGDLVRRMALLATRLKRVEDRVDNTPTRAEFAAMTGELKSLEERSATAVAVTQLEARMATLEERIAGMGGRLEERIAGVARAADRTEEAVVRIENFLREHK
ncbi:MAG: hypothetical protein ACOY45_01825 [Pseudomonadota bacterium]